MVLAKQMRFEAGRKCVDISGLNSRVLRASLAWWRHQIETFSALLFFVKGIHRSTVHSPHKGQWRGTLMFSLICAWTNAWANNRNAGDLRRHRTHDDVTATFEYMVERDTLTHWGWVTHEITSKLTTIGPDNGLVVWRTPRHSLKQYWNIVNWTLRNKLNWNLNRNSRKCIWKCRPGNGGHFVAASMCSQYTWWQVGAQNDRASKTGGLMKPTMKIRYWCLNTSHILYWMYSLILTRSQWPRETYLHHDMEFISVHFTQGTNTGGWLCYKARFLSESL